ncbi:MAG: nitronate monooxygenase, partial [Lentisphaerota bacterium]
TMARRLQLGDPEGHLRRALEHFPIREMANRIIAEYYIPGGKSPSARFKSVAMPTLLCGAAFVTLTVAANFVEVYLAKEGHQGLVGINYLQKIQLPTLPSLYGAMLANVDFVLMGAGIPRAIPGVMDTLSQGGAVELHMDVEGALPTDHFVTTFDPSEFWGGSAPQVNRPKFLAIVASSTLAMALAKKSTGRVDGFIIEGETAGGHNAPPRGPMQLSEKGEPVYGARDVPDLEKFREIGLPFWLAGSYGQSLKLKEALEQGASGVQAGTAFAFCEESGILPELKKQVIQMSRQGTTDVFTDPVASPTGFPFKVLQVPGTLSEESVFKARKRLCDLAYLRHIYRQADGTEGYRCPSEPEADYLRKGGSIEDTIGRKCVCNGLTGVMGLGQVLSAKGSDVECELPLVTVGNDVSQVAQFISPGKDSYTAADVVRSLLSDLPARPT